jgi:GlcNAc-P-P-Und epimerase
MQKNLKWAPDRLAVTGGSGYIGSAFIAEAVRSGIQVLNLDVSSPRRPEHGHLWKQVDILDAPALVDALAQFSPSHVVHFAARTRQDADKDLLLYRTNIDGVENLLGAIARTPTVKRAIFTSSQLVCRLGYRPRDAADFAPDCPYGQSKVRTEQLVRQYGGGGVEWCIVRPTTVWGPDMSDHYLRVLAMIQARTYFHLGMRPLYKSYGYIGNVIYQYMKLLCAPADLVSRQVFYAADYEPISLRVWMDTFQRELGARPIRICNEWVASSIAKAGDFINAAGFRKFPFNSFRLRNVLTEYSFDLLPTKNVCGPLPYSMAEGVRETVSWYLRNSATQR